MQQSVDQDKDQTTTSWDGKVLRSRIVKTLELVQDAIAISLCIGLFCVMVLQLKEIFQSLLTTLHLPPTFEGVDPQQIASARRKDKKITE